MAEERGWEAVGVDLDPKGIAYAKGRLEVNAILGDLRDVHLPHSSFDLVTLWNVVECVPDPLELLRQLRPLLRDGGTIFIRTQNETWHRMSFLTAWMEKRV
jgi:2-polyprenyl-3-methyl-5-hydroxy-6-metoxy-1,4-benzoquinol methylase